MTSPPGDSLNDVYVRVGEALGYWAHVEDSILAIFMCAVSARNSDAMQAAYWKIVSFDAKLAACDAAITHSLSKHPEHLDVWRNLQRQVDKKKKNRNKIAHAMTLMSTDAGEYRLFPYQSVLAPEIKWNGGWPPAQIAEVGASFIKLNDDLIAFIQRLSLDLDMWPTDHRPSPEQSDHSTPSNPT